MSKEKGEEYVRSLNYDPVMPQGERFLNAYLKGFYDCQKEYEEKLRCIPVGEKLPHTNICNELNVVQCKVKNIIPHNEQC